MFTSLPERFIDHLAGEDPRSLADIGGQMVQSFLPPVMPALAAPVVEQATNTRLQSMTPLIPASMERLTGYMRYGPNTTPEAQAVSKFLASPAPYKPTINVDPIVIDNYIKDLGGTLPYQVIHAINGSFRPPSAQNQGLMHDVFTKAFFLSHGDYLPAPLENAWQAVHDFQASHADAMKAVREGNLNAALPRDQMMAAVRVNGLEKALVGLNKMIQGFNDSTTLTLNEKSINVDSLYSHYLPAIEQYTKTLGQAKEQANGR
jgi:hypothetical protein